MCYISTLIHSLRALAHTKEQGIVKRRVPSQLGTPGTWGQDLDTLFCEQAGRRMTLQTTERKQKEVPTTSGPSAFSYLDSHTPLRFAFVHVLHILALMCALLTQPACKPEDLPGLWEGNGKRERRRSEDQKNTGEKDVMRGDLTGLLSDNCPSKYLPLSFIPGLQFWSLCGERVLSLSVFLFSILLPLYPNTQYQNNFSNIEAIVFSVWSGRSRAKLQSEDWEMDNHKACILGFCLPSDLQFLVVTSLALYFKKYTFPQRQHHSPFWMALYLFSTAVFMLSHSHLLFPIRHINPCCQFSME